jgi:hypothetical protein
MSEMSGLKPERTVCLRGGFRLGRGGGLDFSLLQAGLQCLEAGFVGGFQFLQFSAQGIELGVGMDRKSGRDCSRQQGGS